MKILFFSNQALKKAVRGLRMQYCKAVDNEAAS
jgi:hypothetical protein